MKNFINLLKIVFLNIKFQFRFKKTYTQYGEDLIIKNYLLNYKKIRNGKYLDIGAYHPILHSNTYILHKNNYTGFCVDLEDYKLKNFKFYRGNKVKLIKGAVTENKNNTEIDFYYFSRSMGEYSTVSKEFIEKRLTKIKKKYPKISYNTKKIKNIYINDLFREVGKINFLNIDVEGMNNKILSEADLSIIDPEIICVEDDDGYFIKDEKLKSFKEKGYQLVFQSGMNKIFAKV